MRSRFTTQGKAVAAALAVGGCAALAASIGQAQPVRPSSASHGAALAQGAPPVCLIHSLPSFTAQGELENAATVADIVEVECNPYVYGTGSKVTVTASQLFSRCNGRLIWYVPNAFKPGGTTAPGVTVALDAAGNATLALRAGPHCAAGESLVAVHMDEKPFETFTTSFTVLPPQDTTPGVSALPAVQVEDDQASAVATIFEAEFAGASEEKIRIGSEELFARCQQKPHIRWIRLDGSEVSAEQEEGVSEVKGLELDNNGNTFVIAIGDRSCAEGTSLIEADLESKPFTTYTTTFTVAPPQPTAEPSFTIEKRQKISGSGGGFTSAPLTGLIGQTVDYEIVVTNTASVAETLSGFTDPHCDRGSIAGGPGSSPLAPGESAVYTCEHVLTAVGAYVNEATVTANTIGGRPLTQTSNPVVVEVRPEPAFTIEKRQQLMGGTSGFTTSPLTAKVGETVEYEILVKNTGNEALTFSGFSDANCDAGTIAGGSGSAPIASGSSVQYMCSRLLRGAGVYINEASLSGTPSGEAPITHTSNRVEVTVPTVISRGPAFVVEKLQKVVGFGGFTTAILAPVAKGATVDYEIIVRNTGAQPLAFSGFTDAHCDKGTIAGGPGQAQVPPASSTTYTCRHVMGEEKSYSNLASVTGAAPGQTPFTRTSNEVLAEETVLSCARVSLTLHGASGGKRGPFAVRITSREMRRLTLYLDGHRLKRFKASGNGSRFTFTIDPTALAYGAHSVLLKGASVHAECGSAPRSSKFVHLPPPVRPPG